MTTDNHYFKRHWDETTGDELTDSWGTAIFYFETDNDFYVTRQMEVFANGKVLKYENEYTDDKYGGLTAIPLDIEEFEEYKIARDEFEQVWQTSYYKRFPEIVCTSDTLWGQPRLEGRRLAVGDIVSKIVGEGDIYIAVEDYEISMQQAKQALGYCKTLQCKVDKPERFCHNCTLRLGQFNEAINEDDPEQDNWVRAGILFKKYFE